VLISELSRKTNASVRSLRYYETKKMLTPKRLENGYREYDDTAIERVKTIKLYLSLGLNIDDILKIIDCSNTTQTRPMCPAAFALYKEKLYEVNRQIDILLDVQAKLLERISDFKTSAK